MLAFSTGAKLSKPTGFQVRRHETSDADGSGLKKTVTCEMERHHGLPATTLNVCARDCVNRVSFSCWKENGVQ